MPGVGRPTCFLIADLGREESLDPSTLFTAKLNSTMAPYYLIMTPIPLNVSFGHF